MELLLERAKKQGRAKKRSFLRKHILQLGGHALASVSRAVVHRATKGPIFPNFSVRNELFYQLMLELMDKHYLLSWQEWRHLMPMQPIPRWHLRRTKVVLKNGLKTEFITYVPRRRHLRSKKHNNKKHKKNNDSDDNHSTTGRENDMFYGDAEDFDDSQGVGPDSSGHKLDASNTPGNSTTNHGSSATVTGQMVNGAAEGNHRGVKDIGLDTPTIIYFHGGGFCFGSVPVYRRWLWTFSRKLGGIRFFAVDYSLAPEAPFPIALKQALDSYLWLTDPNGGGVSPQNVIMGGDSAGGNLVGALLVLIRQMRLEKELKIMHGTNTSMKKKKKNKTKTERPEIDAEQVQSVAKGKEVNEPEQMIDETSEQEQERLQDEGELEFDEDEDEAEKERQLHQQLYVRRQSMADFKSSAERVRQRVAKEKQAKAKRNRKAKSADGRPGAKRKEKVDTPSQTTDDEAALGDGDIKDYARESRDGGGDDDDEAASLPTLKAIGFDMELVRRHRIPFELDEDQAGKYPSMPLAAMQISPWVDVSENSSVHCPESWGHMKFRPYNISVRFALAYLGLEATDPPAAKEKERQTRREWNSIVKLFHQRRQRRLQSKSKKQQHDGSTQAAVAVPQQQPPTIYVDDEPAAAADLLTPTQIWRDRLRRSNSMLSSTNLLAKSAARSAAEVAECEIAIGKKRHGGEGSVVVEADDHDADAAGLGPQQQQQQREPDTFDICSPYISPVYGDMRGFPPLLVSAGDVEPLLGDIMRYYHKAVDAGIEAEMDLGKNMNHDYQFFFSAVAMSDPEIPRFWGVARSWVHRQLQREIQPSTPSTATSAPVPSPSSTLNHA